ncbi:MAG: methyltransferase domain-containing protein [Mesorhizobium sp.]|nr:methyltransferase domain-containing protein [Mesorhizobium sp. M1A.F.Ca.IN.022.06.1.1]PBB35309.1 methyltransferase [Mesorhizobium sp. WSM3882]RUU95512.1 methyltransferase domain-containing protein [Mesorhizobium sp. M1A.F.Ca.IN.020.03.2.1]RUV65943.1 methyltransferase domain-containing protein [Mesorhizobium sp. M1A.F.Ca.IN.022.02.1.1]RUV78147.1 methyltransferase domain-containing protein [Mesorhizobium sp. M1A.F.Ca.IN.020.30.1.1]RUV83344.1 methyltransferase domain-containing protein [Mesorh
MMAASTALAPDTPAHTVDAFHRGRFWLVQPRQGHRAGMDAMMLAAAVPSGFSGRLADFGAGAGAATLAVLSRCPEAHAVLVERSEEMAAFAAATLAHPGNAHLGDRASVLKADVTLAGRARHGAGLADNSFDFVVMNPPFNAAQDRATPDALRREAHVAEDGLFERWIRSAAAVVKPRGGLAAIARPEQLVAILDAMEGRFGDAEMLCVHPRPDAAAIRIVVRAVLGARGKLSIRPPLTLHGASGNEPTERTEMINNGLASLFGD